MGTWGPGNFDSDIAADHVEVVVGRIVEEITTAMAGDPAKLDPDADDGYIVPCNVELLALIAEQGWLGVALPPHETIDAWKQRFLAVWDERVDALYPKPEWKIARRAVLVATFDRLAKLSREKE